MIFLRNRYRHPLKTDLSAWVSYSILFCKMELCNAKRYLECNNYHVSMRPQSLEKLVQSKTFYSYFFLDILFLTLLQVKRYLKLKRLSRDSLRLFFVVKEHKVAFNLKSQPSLDQRNFIPVVRVYYIHLYSRGITLFTHVAYPLWSQSKNPFKHSLLYAKFVIKMLKVYDDSFNGECKFHMYMNELITSNNEIKIFRF